MSRPGVTVADRERAWLRNFERNYLTDPRRPPSEDACRELIAGCARMRPGMFLF